MVETSFRKKQGGYWDDCEVQILSKENASGYYIIVSCASGWDEITSVPSRCYKKSSK